MFLLLASVAASMLKPLSGSFLTMRQRDKREDVAVPIGAAANRTAANRAAAVRGGGEGRRLILRVLTRIHRRVEEFQEAFKGSRGQRCVPVPVAMETRGGPGVHTVLFQLLWPLLGSSHSGSCVISLR